MCLSIPAEVISIENQTARVQLSGVTCEARLDLVDQVQVGDYVLVHSGYVLEKMDPQTAAETLSLYHELIESMLPDS